MNKYPDYFTEYTIPNFKNTNIKHEYNDYLSKILPSPIKNKNRIQILQNIFNYFLDGKEFILYQKYQQKYGQNMSSNFVIPYYDEYNKKIVDMVILCNPNDCMRIAKEHFNKIPNLKMMMADSIISTTNIDHWKIQRKHFIDPFIPHTSLKKIMPISEERAIYFSNYLQKHLNQQVDINDLFLHETQAQLQLALFGVNNNFQEKYNKKIRLAFNTIGKKGFIRDITFKFIEKIKNDEFNGPLAKSLKNSPQQTDTELYGNIILFLFAGHDTTGHTLSWLMFELCKNQHYQLKLQQEIDNFWKYKGNNQVLLEDFKHLDFMNKCIFETLRLYPAVANGTYRIIDTDIKILNKYNKKVIIPKGTYIQIPNFFRHRNDTLWEKPNTFNPYRTFNNDECWHNGFSAQNPESYRYSPFMYNSRSCLGKHFAQIEMRLILLHIFKKYHFTLSPKQKINNIEYNRGTMGPKNGLKVIINKRIISKL